MAGPRCCRTCCHRSWLCRIHQWSSVSPCSVLLPADSWTMEKAHHTSSQSRYRGGSCIPWEAAAAISRGGTVVRPCPVSPVRVPQVHPRHSTGALAAAPGGTAPAGSSQLPPTLCGESPGVPSPSILLKLGGHNAATTTLAPTAGLRDAVQEKGTCSKTLCTNASGLSPSERVYGRSRVLHGGDGWRQRPAVPSTLLAAAPLCPSQGNSAASISDMHLVSH